MKALRQLTGTGRGLLGQTLPLYVHFGITHRCNMRCRMCRVWEHGDRGSELTAAQVDTLAGQLRQAGTLWIALGGGEPFVRSDLPEIIRSFASRGLEVRLLTNGIGISDRRLADAVAAGVTNVSISLDTLDGARQREIYGGIEVQSEILSSIRRFRRLLPRTATPVVNVCVSRMNISELPALVSFAAAEGFFCSFVPIALASTPEANDDFAAYAPELAIGPEQQAQVRESYHELLRLKRRGAPIANSSRFLADSARHLCDGSYPWRCDAGRLYLSIGPEGAVSICHRFQPFANHADPDLAALMARGDNRRRAAQQRTDCPGCMRPCWAEITHLFHHPLAAAEALMTVPLALVRGGRR